MANPGLNAPRRILVVDDERLVCQCAEKILGRKGFRVDQTLSTESALAKIETGHAYDLIIADLMMPQAGGMELLKVVNDRWPEVPILMITGYPSIATAVEAARLGAVGYLDKPFTPEELSRAVEESLSREKTPQVLDLLPAKLLNESIAEEVSWRNAREGVPREPSGKRPLMARAKKGLPRGGSKVGRILVVDDEPVVGSSIRKALSQKGHRVEEAFTGREALRKVLIQSYDLVLLDMRLPDVNGLDLLSTIKSHRPGLPVAIITGYASIATAFEAIRRGGEDYLPKPFTPEELQALTGRTLEKAAARSPSNLIHMSTQDDDEGRERTWRMSSWRSTSSS